MEGGRGERERWRRADFVRTRRRMSVSVPLVDFFNSSHAMTERMSGTEKMVHENDKI